MAHSPAAHAPSHGHTEPQKEPETKRNKEYEKGKKEEEKLADAGYDTDYNTTSAWSTLGWFRDPILSNILYRTEGQVADLIIHEMTHATLYAKSSVDFNENLASAIGEVGAELFLKYKYV